MNKTQLLLLLRFIIMMVIADQFLGFGLSKFYFSQKAGQSKSLNYCFLECNEDIIIFGNSRAQHHYDPKIISNALSLSCYNAGIDGGHSILLFCAQIKVVTKRYTPKIIIVELSNTNLLEFNKKDYEKLAILKPYFRKIPEVQYYVDLIGPYENIKRLSSIYPFNSVIFNTIRFNTDFDTDRNWMFNGYIPIVNKQMNKAMIGLEEAKKEPNVIDSNKVAAMIEIINICKVNNIKLFFALSPKYGAIHNLAGRLSAPQQKCLEIINIKKIKMLDFFCNPRFINDMTLFADPAHLNQAGATVYSNLIADTLRKLEFLKK